MAAVTIHSDFGAQENKICDCFHFFTFSLPWSDGMGCHDLGFFNAEFKARFFTLLFHPHQEGETKLKRSLVPLHFLQLYWYYLHIWGCWYFSLQFFFNLKLFFNWRIIALQNFIVCQISPWINHISLLAILIPACDSSNLEFHIRYTANKLLKQSDNI